MTLQHGTTLQQPDGRHDLDTRVAVSAPPQPQKFDALSSAQHMQGGERLIRLPELLRTIGVSRATAYRYMDAGRLPRPIKLSSRCSAWKASTINDWLARLNAA